MNEKPLEEVIMELIVNSGNARSMAMEAIKCAKACKYDEADRLISDAENEIHKAHEFQTELVYKEAGGEKIEMSLLMCHGQDHLMTAMVVIEMAEEFLELYKIIKK
ncbi:MAG: PTS lactose/cellobiose transporter subunit IIA [Tyzzerella sp.]|uniref:PTS lactose/cellobiose transporter subunit IIA n=1 Tax=Candidatus Fimicola merdigallinarum TaxID=2840819 RepID=A0A9D9DW35_9FIRM|nr:PTS lactose/cellobiose transporter subunit IIA [Candidatus Fimicola merdigallinarum]